jgi:hypothetical protein
LPQVQTNSKKIIEQIELYNRKGTVPDEFTKQRLIREIDDLPDLDSRLETRAVLEAVCKNKEVAFELFEEALAVSESYGICQNYWVALKSFGITSDVISKGFELAERCTSYKMFNELLVHSAIILDVENMNHIFEILTKAKKLKNDENTRLAEREAKCMDEFLNNSDLKPEQLKAVGEIAINLIDEFGIELISNEIAHKKQRDHLSVEYVVSESSLNSLSIFDLNYELAGRIVEQNLDTIPVVAQFRRKKVETGEPEGIANAG